MTMKKFKKIPKTFRKVCKCWRCNKPYSIDSRKPDNTNGLCRACRKQ